MNEKVAGAQEVRQIVVRVPAGEEDVRAAEALDRVDRMLALPLAGVAADQDQRSGFAKAGVGPREGLDQQRQALDLAEAAKLKQHGTPQRLQDIVPVSDAARR